MLCTDQREAQDCVASKFIQKQRMKAKKLKIVGYDLPYRTLKVFLHLFERISDLTNSVFVRHLEARAVGPAPWVVSNPDPSLGFLDQLFQSPPKRV